MTLNSDQIVGMLAGICFAAGLNVYATVATVGLLARTGVVTLPPAIDSLQSGWIISAALALFALEFFADKVPAFDLVWNALQTFVRIPVAALLAFAATSHLPLGWRLAATAMGGLIAFAAHGGKTALRAAVTPSPEPVSNIALSLGEDVGAVALSWIAVEHPYVAAGVVAVLLVVVVLVMRWVVRALRGLFSRTRTANAPP